MCISADTGNLNVVVWNSAESLPKIFFGIGEIRYTVGVRTGTLTKIRFFEFCDFDDETLCLGFFRFFF